MATTTTDGDRAEHRTYTLAEASRLCGIPYATLRRMVDRGDLEADTSNPKRYAIRERDLPRRPSGVSARASDARLDELARQVAALQAEVDALRRRLDREHRPRREWSPSALYGDSEAASGPNQPGIGLASDGPESAHTAPYTPVRTAVAARPVSSDLAPATDFGKRHGVPANTAANHVREGGPIPATHRPRKGRPGQWQHFLDEEQRRAALRFWRDEWTPDSGEGPHRCGDPLCECVDVFSS